MKLVNTRGPVAPAVVIDFRPLADADPDRPVGVIDIGSNSIRLVVFEGGVRSPVALFNEKSLCGLGRGLGRTGQLNEAGIVCALAALRRFRAIARALHVQRLVPVATAAVREATNRDEFVKQAGDILGVPVRILSGDEEAELSARGVLCGIPDANGIVADLGGGSLEMIDLATSGEMRATSTNLGPLRLIDGGLVGARAEARRVLEETAVVTSGTGRPLYLVGGAFRTLARVQMAQTNYPIRVLQQFTMTPDEATQLARLISSLSRRELEAIDEINGKRAETLPYAALVLEELIAVAKPSAIVISAFGLREGLFHALLSDDRQAVDPLLDGVRGLAERHGRISLGAELFEFLDGLALEEGDNEQRLRLAASFLCDVSWRSHPDDRAASAFNLVLRSSIAGVTHRERVFLGLVLYNRYGGPADSVPARMARDFLTSKERDRAEILGKAMRFALTFTGHAPGILPRLKIKREKTTLKLVVAAELAELVGEAPEKRLQQLADALGLKSANMIIG